MLSNVLGFSCNTLTMSSSLVNCIIAKAMKRFSVMNKLSKFTNNYPIYY